MRNDSGGLWAWIETSRALKKVELLTPSAPALLQEFRVSFKDHVGFSRKTLTPRKQDSRGTRKI